MGRSRGLSESDRQDLLARIESLLGESPKGKLVKEIVESLPRAEEHPVESDAQTDVSGAD